MKESEILTKVLWFNRIAIFIVFFWFGFLKVIHISPAETLVQHLHQVTIGSLISIDTFVPLLGYLECTIGVLFLLPKFTRVAFGLFIVQMSATFLPLFLLPKDTWSGFALSLTGQYIVKNVVLVAAAYAVYVGHHNSRKTGDNKKVNTRQSGITEPMALQ